MRIDVSVATQYRSFRHGLVAENLNDFVVLTGANGSGKSQLLQILTNRGYISAAYPEASATITVGDQVITHRSVVGIFDWNLPGTPIAGMAEVNNFSSTVHGAVVSALQGNMGVDENYFSQEQIDELWRLADAMRTEGYAFPHRVPDVDDVAERLPPRFADKSAQIINERIATIIYDWHITALQERRDFDDDDNPIEVFNSLCRDFAVNFRLPALVDIRKPYTAVLINAEGDPVQWQDLSSGEKVLFRIICWLFYYRTRHNLYPKLLLLDEPDAHLTPGMIRRFMTNLRETVHERMGISVVLTSHSPNTVALVEEDSLYELQRLEGGHRQIVKTSRRDALRRLSEGLLFVQEDTRLVFVEGADDQPFYESLYGRAVASGALGNVPSLKFIAASVAQPESGGCTKVVEVVSRFAETSVEPIVVGLIDRDLDNAPQAGVRVIDRYSIENYLYDPFLIACNFVIQGKQAALAALAGVATGNWRLLVDNSVLRQSAIDEVVGTVRPFLAEKIGEAGLAEDPVTVTMDTAGGAVTYDVPNWVLRLKGKAYVSGGLHHVSSPFKNLTSSGSQYLAMDTIQGMPKDLLQILEDIAS